MLCAGAKFASWLDLAPLANMATQASNVLVIDASDVVDAKPADFPARSIATPTTATGSPATWPSAAFAPGTSALSARAKPGARFASLLTRRCSTSETCPVLSIRHEKLPFVVRAEILATAPLHYDGSD